jgi:hypothetical protein
MVDGANGLVVKWSPALQVQQHINNNIYHTHTHKCTLFPVRDKQQNPSYSTSLFFLMLLPVHFSYFHDILTHLTPSIRCYLSIVFLAIISSAMVYYRIFSKVPQVITTIAYSSYYYGYSMTRILPHSSTNKQIQRS